ncbi:nucleotide-binding universal stress UspA family protein [Crossiella equi]|uniref:Nucleotide-binding universal stress UspA family protein n=1 Tax=Crossiella equi TaxID=130796 RepID=A0ABS5AKY0_9PSEU|nr:universal stress protein [Crossiella equi]MBP2477230.1 nucleotide-binding universal stress UspA family protein [Crossiella equi]
MATDTQFPRRVVAGVDGSPPSRTAAHWAATEAVHRGLPLRLVWAHEVTSPAYATTEPGVKPDPVYDWAHQGLQELVARCRTAFPSLDVHGDFVPGDPLDVLAEHTHDAELLVLGAAGRSAATGIRLGSIASTLVRTLDCPVVVLRTPPGLDAGPVVVGVDGSTTSAAALDFAVDFAARHQHRLVAVHAWSDLPLDALAPIRAWDFDPEILREEGKALLRGWLQPHRDQHPELTVTEVVTTEKPVDALLEQGANASLLVVGSHGRGAVRRLLLGSVSHAVVHYAAVPVAVVRSAKPD